MQEKWNFSSSFLPHAGEPIEFRLDTREQPINGVFTEGVFHSRWADYALPQVGSWRRLERAPVAWPIGAPAATSGAFSEMLKRMKSIIFRHHGNDLQMPRHHRTRITPIATAKLPAIKAVAQVVYSNQISS